MTNERAAVTTGGSAINVLGVDYQSRRGRTEAPDIRLTSIFPEYND